MGVVLASSLCVPGLAAEGGPDLGVTASRVTSTLRCQDADAVRVHPGDDLPAAIRDAGRGGLVCFAAGTYRLRRALTPLAGQSLVGHGAVLTGSRVLHGFRRVADGWVVGGQRQQGERNGECEHGRACTYPDDVIRDGVPLHRVLSAGALRPGAYYFDYRRDEITVSDDPDGHVVEAMVASCAITSRPGPAGRGVTVRGFVVEHVASRAQHGAIEADAPDWLIAGNTVQVNHGAGITSAGHVQIIGNTVLRNGQLGIGGTGAVTLVAHNEIAGNNTGGFDPGWEAGGAKWAVTDGLVVRDNRVHDNDGPGLWTDIDAQHTTYLDNVVRDNSRAGIFHEISADAVIRGNVVTGNGYGFGTWLWGSGILLAGSHDVDVSANLLRGNAEGIGLIQQRRGRSSVDGKPRRLHDISIHDNVTWMASGASGAVEDDGYTRLFTDPTITWSGDVWHQAHGTPFAWDDHDLTLSEWRALGHDLPVSRDGGCGRCSAPTAPPDHPTAAR